MSGEWQERGVASDYLEKSSVHCDCCGRMIMSLAWIVDGLVFCEPDCERVWRTYLAARRGVRA
jgi:hypothetical protein